MSYEGTRFSYAAIFNGRRKQTSLDTFMLKRSASESEESVPKKARVSDGEEEEYSAQ